MRISGFLVLGLLSVGAASLHADHWPQFRGPNASGIAANGKEIPTRFGEKDGILWKVAIPGLGNSSPVIWDDRMFLQTSSKDGKERILLCLDSRSGKQLWSQMIAGKSAHFNPFNSLASATPATDGSGVYIAIWDGRDVVLAGYSMNGEPLWKRDLGPFISQHGPAASPIIYKDLVIFANDMDREDHKTKAPVDHPSVLMALNKKTGEVVWETPRQAVRACYSLPLLRERKGAATELIITSTTAVTSYNPENGAKNWEWTPSFKSKMPLRTVASSLLDGDRLYVLSGDGGGDRQMWALTLTGTGKETKVSPAWENRKDFPYVPCILSLHERVYFVNDKGSAGCYDAKTGERIWLERLPGATFTASPVLIENRIFAPSEEGDVYVLAAAPKHEILAKNQLGERIRATPAVADNRLYIRGQNHLFCIGKN